MNPVVGRALGIVLRRAVLRHPALRGKPAVRLALALAAALGVAACDPVTKIRDLEGANGSNTPFVIRIDRDAPDRAATWSQEYYEALEKRDPVKLYRIRNDIGERREMEIASHAIEVAAAARFYGRDPAVKRVQEARSMQAGYGGMFKGWTVAEIEAAMLKKHAWAVRWVDRHKDEIAEQMEKNLAR